MKNFKYEQTGDKVLARGDNWTYEQVGDLSCFTQTGKVSSLRIVKTLIKECNELNRVIKEVR